MRITKINILKEDNIKDGLESIKMDRLDRIVLIAGKNGSGKTRILNKIFTTLNSKPKISHMPQLNVRLGNAKNNIPLYEQAILALKEVLLTTTDAAIIEKHNTTLASHNTKLNIELAAVIETEAKFNWIIETDELSEKYSSVHFVPKTLILDDCNSFSKNDMINKATNISLIGIAQLPTGVFSKIQVIQDRWFEATHQGTQATKEEIKIAIDDYDKLLKLIFIFLNVEITRSRDGEACLFGFALGKSNLSDGQKILLQFCMAIYSQETALKDLILILDEPENHLHPSVIIEMIERIQKCVSNGQIWIATHSVPLLAHFDPSLIWFVEDGKISHAGKIPEKVLESLLGNESEIGKLQDFISLPGQYATSRYAFESLCEPNVVQTDSNDPQSFQIRTDLLKLTSNGRLKILDYGAGKGRLISNIFDLDQSSQQKLIESIDYIAYDKYLNDKEQCENALTKAYGNHEKRYFNEMDKLLSDHDESTFDVVIMCNVLHEIDPKDWLKFFKSDGIISKLLTDNGILLLVEDHQIPVGEKAYQKGFLVLDTIQLKKLFKVMQADVDFQFSDYRGDGRLKAHRIPKNCLIRIDDKSRRDALESMSATSKEKILEIRQKEINYPNGKLHGFWTQQFANAQLNLEDYKV